MQWLKLDVYPAYAVLLKQQLVVVRDKSIVCFKMFICLLVAQCTLINIILNISRRVMIALASVNSTAQFKNIDSISQYRLALSRIQAIPFGVMFFGTRRRVSYGDMYAISSIVVSIFFFMLGYSNHDNKR
jgi:nicotinic acid phosphoribosyltransferase